MFNQILKYIFKYAFLNDDYEAMWKEEAKKILLNESINIVKNLILLQFVIALYALAAFELVHFFSTSIQAGSLQEYLPLLNFGLLASLATGLSIKIINYCNRIKEQISMIGAVYQKSHNIFSPIFEQLQKEQTAFLVELHK